MKEFIRRHLRISLVVMFFITLILLPQFNFCSAGQTDITGIKILSPKEDKEYTTDSKLFVRWTTSNIIPSNNTNNNSVDNTTSSINNTIPVNLGIKPKLAQGYYWGADWSGCFEEFILDVFKGFSIGVAVIGGVVGTFFILYGIAYSSIKKKKTRENIKIDLLKKTNLVQTIIDEVSNDGAYIWHIPPDFPPGDDYAVKLSLVKKPEVFSISDGYFTITSDETEEEESTENNYADDDNTSEKTNNDNNDDDSNNENKETNNNIVTEAHRETFSYMDDGIKTFDASLLPNSMKHYVYYNFDNIENEMNNATGKKEKVINKFLSKTINDNLAPYLLPYEKELGKRLARNTVKENLELFSDAKEILMGIETIMNYPERPPMTMLMLVEDAETITDRLSAQPDVYIKDSIEGLDVYMSNMNTAIIFNESVIGVTTKGLEYELIKSFNNPNQRLKDRINRNSDLMWFDLDFDELKYDVDLSSMNINPDKLDRLNVNLSRGEHSYNFYSEILLKDADLTEEYASIFNERLNALKLPVTKALTTTNQDANEELLSVMNDLEMENGNSSIYIELEIEDGIINNIFK